MQTTAKGAHRAAGSLAWRQLLHGPSPRWGAGAPWRKHAALLYDHLPIVDDFRRLDAHTLLGVMDARGISQPFFFTLRREGSDVASRA